MARALLLHVVQDAAGNAQSGVPVTVYETNGTTLLAATMFSASSGGTTLTNPLTSDAYGLVTAYVASPQRCVVSVGGRAVASEFEPDPATLLLAGLGSIVNADVNAAAAIAYSKLALGGSIVNADVNAAAAIAYSKLALANGIVNADVNAAAAIALSKLAAGASGFVRSNGTTISAGNGLVAADLAGLAAVQLGRVGLGADTATVSFGAGTISTAYKALLLVIQSRSSLATNADVMTMRLGAGSADSGANYDNADAYANGAGVVGEGATGATALAVAYIPGSTSPASAFATTTITIPDFTSTAFHKNYVGQNTYRSSAVSSFVEMHGGTWRSTAAIDTIQFACGASFKTGSTFTLYGLP